MSYLIWIPAVIIWYTLYAYVSKLNNDLKTTPLFIATLIAGFCPFWAIVSRNSKNIVFDGLLYDILMFLTYTGTMLILGSANKFETHQWVGLFVVFVGFVLMKI